METFLWSVCPTLLSADFLRNLNHKSSPLLAFPKCSTVLSYYKERQNEKVMWCVKQADDRLLRSARLHSLYLQQTQTFPNIPELRSEQDHGVLTLIKAHCLKKSSICCFLGLGAKN